MEWSKIYKLTFLSSNFFSCIIGFFENSLKHKIYCFETFFFNNFQKNEYYPYIRSSPHVSTDIFSYKFHIFPIFQHNHWLLGIAELSELKSSSTLCPMNVKITILDSIVDEVRKGSCFKVLKSFYLKVISRIYGFKKLETILNENINDIQAFQKNGYDCGAFSMYHLHKFLFKNYFASEFPPEKHSEIGIFYRKIIFSKASDVFDDSSFYDEKQNDDEFIKEKGNDEDLTFMNEIKMDDENVITDYKGAIKTGTLSSKSQKSQTLNPENSLNIPSPKSECSFRKCVDVSPLKSMLDLDSIDRKEDDELLKHVNFDFSMPPEENDFFDIRMDNFDKDETSIKNNYVNDDTLLEEQNASIKYDDLIKCNKANVHQSPSLNISESENFIPSIEITRTSSNNTKTGHSERLKLTSSQYEIFKSKFVLKKIIEQLEQIAFTFLNFNMKAGVRAILSLPVSFYDNQCVTWKQLSYDHVYYKNRKKDNLFCSSWKNFIDELISQKLIIKRFDNRIIRNGDVLY